MDTPRQDVRDAHMALLRKQELDVRIQDTGQDWIADRLADYLEQRHADLSHDQALRSVLASSDVDQGGPTPAPVAVITPPMAIQPLVSLIPLEPVPGKVRLLEEIRVIRGSRDVTERVRWTWKGLYLPNLYLQYTTAEDGSKLGGSVEQMLAWAQGLGANTVVSSPPEDPYAPTVQAFLTLCCTFHLRVYWEGATVVKSVTPQPVPMDPSRKRVVTTVEDPPDTRDPLDAANVIVTQDPPETFTPNGPNFAYWLGILAVWAKGGGNLDPRGTLPRSDESQRIAEWWFRGLSAVDPETRDWTTVKTGPLPIQDDPSWRDAVIAKVNGQQALVVVVNPTPARLLKAQPPWQIDTMTGPGYSLVHCHR